MVILRDIVKENFTKIDSQEHDETKLKFGNLKHGEEINLPLVLMRLGAIQAECCFVCQWEKTTALKLILQRDNNVDFAQSNQSQNTLSHQKAPSAELLHQKYEK